MTAMSHRQRVLTALNHQEPDRVPIDFGGAAMAGINVTAYARLVDFLGLRQQAGDTHLASLTQQMAAPAEAVQQRLDVDLRPVYIGAPDSRPAMMLSPEACRDEWGVTWVKPEGQGHFHIARYPFQQSEPTQDDLDAYPWPDPRDPGRVRGLAEQARKLREETDYALVLNLPWDLNWGCQRLRGFSEWSEDLVVNPRLAEALLERVSGLIVELTGFLLDEVGDYVDVVLLSDDLGFQDRPSMRPELYRKRIKPYHRRLVDAIKSKTRAKVLMHSCGSVYPLIPDLIEIGVDALNPVQVSAVGMDTQRLKAEFGDSLAFWGAIDTQRILPLGAIEDVRAEVKRRIQDLAPGGGYVLAAVHVIQAEVPPDNVVAMYQSARELGCYPIVAGGTHGS